MIVWWIVSSRILLIYFTFFVNRHIFLVSSFVLMKPTKQQNVKRPALQAHRAYYSCPQEKNGLKSLTFLVLGYQYDRDRHAALKCVR